MNSTRLPLIVLTLWIACSTCLWAADPDHVDQTLHPDRDARLCSTDPDPKGTLDEFQSGFSPDEKGQIGEYRILMHFDMGELQKKPVRCAILRICAKNNTGGRNSLFMRAHAMYHDWDEKFVTWLNSAKDEPWNNEGGDFLIQPYGGASIPANWRGEEDHYYSFDVTTLIQAWQTKTLKNHGLIIMHELGSDNYQRFRSRESDTTPPHLWISYSGAITSPDQTVLAVKGMQPVGPVTDLNPHIQTKDLKNGSTNTPYKVQLTAKGGERPYKWEIPAGSKLPAGFTLSETGELSGMTDKPSATSFEVKCSGTDKKSDTARLSLMIKGDGPPIPPPMPAANDPKKPPAEVKPVDPKRPNDDG